MKKSTKSLYDFADFDIQILSKINFRPLKKQPISYLKEIPFPKLEAMY
ncbi:hypothetical protein LG296_12190 [Ureibacillus chungkukjangi]